MSGYVAMMEHERWLSGRREAEQRETERREAEQREADRREADRKQGEEHRLIAEFGKRWHEMRTPEIVATLRTRPATLADLPSILALKVKYPAELQYQSSVYKRLIKHDQNAIRVLIINFSQGSGIVIGFVCGSFSKERHISRDMAAIFLHDSEGSTLCLHAIGISKTLYNSLLDKDLTRITRLTLYMYIDWHFHNSLQIKRVTMLVIPDGLTTMIDWQFSVFSPSIIGTMAVGDGRVQLYNCDMPQIMSYESLIANGYTRHRPLQVPIEVDAHILAIEKSPHFKSLLQNQPQRL